MCLEVSARFVVGAEVMARKVIAVRDRALSSFVGWMLLNSQNQLGRNDPGSHQPEG